MTNYTAVGIVTRVDGSIAANIRVEGDSWAALLQNLTAEFRLGAGLHWHSITVRMKKLQKAPKVGTVISGTMRPQDLVPMFLSTLEDYDPAEADRIEQEYGLVIPALVLYADRVNQLIVAKLMRELFDALDTVANPHGLYFGSTEGDGSDYGFWPYVEAEHVRDDLGLPKPKAPSDCSICDSAAEDCTRIICPVHGG